MPSTENGVVRILAAVGRAAADARLGIFLVGGALRDLELRRSPKDVDLAVEASAERTLGLADGLGRLRGWRPEASHQRFGTATLVAPNTLRVDLASTRTETYPRPGSLPVVKTGAPILEDLRRRDFTIHAMARSVASDGAPGSLIDPFDGLTDLGERRLRLLHPGSLVDDPTRALRAVAYAVRLGFEIDRSVRAALARARGEKAFQAVSGDRLRRGLEQVLAEDDFEKAKELLSSYVLLDDICPGWGKGLQREISSKGEERQGADDGAEPRGVASRWAQLLAGLPLSRKKDVAERLNFSRALRRSAGVPLR